MYLNNNGKEPCRKIREELRVNTLTREEIEMLEEFLEENCKKDKGSVMYLL